MVIKTNVNLITAIDNLVAVVTDRLLSEDIKNIIFKVGADSSVHVAAYSTSVICYAEIEGAEVDWENETPTEQYFQTKAELIKLLNVYRSLSRTILDTIEIIPSGAYVTLKIHEISKDENHPEFDKISKHRLASPALKSGIQAQLEKYNLDFTGTTVSATDFMVYLDALIPTIPPEARDNTISSKITFTAEKIYTAPSLFFALLDNKLDPVCSDFMLTLTSAKFLKVFLAQSETCEVEKDVSPSAVILKIRCGSSIAVIHALSLKSAIDYTPYAQHSRTGIVLDKKYMQDVMKRATLDSDVCNVKVTITGTSATCSFATRSWCQDLAVLKSRLDPTEFGADYIKTAADGSKSIDIAFSIRPDILAKLIMTHASNFNDLVFLYFEPSGSNGFKMSASDNTCFWQTKINTLSSAKAEVLI